MSPEIRGLIKFATGAIYITCALLAPLFLTGYANGTVSSGVVALKCVFMLLGLAIIWKTALSPKKRRFILRSAGVLYVASSAGILVPYMSLAILTAITGFYLFIHGFIELMLLVGEKDPRPIGEEDRRKEKK